MSELPMSAEERLAELERKVNMMWNGGGDLLGTEGYLQIGTSRTNGSHRFDSRGYQLANNGSAGFGIGATGLWFVPYLHPQPQIGSAGVYPQTVMSGFARESDGQTQLTLRGQTALNDNVFIAQFIANPTSASIQLEVDSASNDSVALVLESPDTGDPAAYIQVGSTTYNLLGGGGMPTPIAMGPSAAIAIGTELASRASVAPTSSAFPAANRAILYPFYLSEDITVTQLWAYNGATASGNIDVGIYDSAFARQISSGSTAQSGTNVLQVFDVTDTPLTAGQYYMAVAMDNATGTLFRQAQQAEFMRSIGCFQMASAFALPSTITPAAVTSNYVPHVGWTRKTTI